MLTIRCCSLPPRQLPSGTKRPPRPLPKIVTRKTVKQQIHLAKLICENYEDSYECKAAWEHVQELENHLNKVEDAVKFMEFEDDEYFTNETGIKDREYDL